MELVTLGGFTFGRATLQPVRATALPLATFSPLSSHAFWVQRGCRKYSRKPGKLCAEKQYLRGIVNPG
jgi:hypothetical protein